ncbi:MAG: ROK family protein, partial [Oscillospiraceae bacterium]
MSKLYMGVDLGGTNIVAGVVDEAGVILCKKSVKTLLPKPESQIEQDIYELCLGLCEANGYDIKNDIISIGVGTPGAVNSQKGLVSSNVNFGYKNWEITEHLKSLFNKPVYVENDANAAIVAEVMAGSAAGCKDAVIVTLGTGIGGGVFIDGKVFSGHNFAGTEVGHMVIEVG